MVVFYRKYIYIIEHAKPCTTLPSTRVNVEHMKPLPPCRVCQLYGVLVPVQSWDQVSAFRLFIATPQKPALTRVNFSWYSTLQSEVHHKLDLSLKYARHTSTNDETQVNAVPYLFISYNTIITDSIRVYLWKVNIEMWTYSLIVHLLRAVLDDFKQTMCSMLFYLVEFYNLCWSTLW